MTRPRLTGLVTLACCALVAARNWAQSNEVNVQLHGFQDTRSVTVLSPTADLAKDFTERTSLRVSFGVDAISAASDSCARCHRDGVNSQRQATGVSVTQKFGPVKWTVGGAYSHEDFYRSTTALTSLSRDFAEGNTTVAGGYTFSLNRPMLHPTPEFEQQYQNNAFVSVTQTLSKLTIAQIGYELSRITGYQSNPFLRANVNGEMVLGQVPDTRTRQTESVRLRQALPADTYLEADYRHYSDDWQLHSNSLELGISHYFSPQWLANVSYRRYGQSAAFFYQPEYTGTPQYFTADFRLEPFSSNLYAAKIVLAPRGGLLWMPAGTGLTLQYERYQADNGFQAGIFTTGLRVPLKAR